MAVREGRLFPFVGADNANAPAVIGLTSMSIGTGRNPLLVRRSLLTALVAAVVVLGTATAATAADGPAGHLDRYGSPLPDRGDRYAKVDHGAAARALAADASGHFQPLETITTGSWPQNVAIGDVTGDGRNDVLLSTIFYFDDANDYKLSVYAQRADGTLAPAVKYDTRLGYSSQGSIAVLDANGDGRSDVALTTESGVQIFTQSTGGTLVDQGLLAGSPEAQSVVAADIDGDRDTDLLTAGRSGVIELAQGPAGVFTPVPVTAQAAGTVRVGDLNGDRRPDAATYSGNTATVHLNLADGWHSQAPVTAGDSINSIEVADVTGEGRADLVVTAGGNRPSSIVEVFSQTRRGTLDNGVTYPVVDIPEPIRAADITGDGRLDLVTAHGGWNTLTTLKQKADRTLAAPETDPLPYASHYSNDGLAVGDVNSDGRPDVVIADYNDGLLIARNAHRPRS